MSDNLDKQLTTNGKGMYWHVAGYLSLGGYRAVGCRLPVKRAMHLFHFPDSQRKYPPQKGNATKGNRYPACP